MEENEGAPLTSYFFADSQSDVVWRPDLFITQHPSRPQPLEYHLFYSTISVYGCNVYYPLFSGFSTWELGRVSGSVSLLHVPIAFIDLRETNGASGRRGIFYGKVDPELTFTRFLLFHATILLVIGSLCCPILWGEKFNYRCTNVNKFPVRWRAA